MTKTMIKKSLRAYISRRQFIFSVLLHREMVGVAFFQVGKQQIDGALIFLVVLAGFAGVDKFQQGNKVHFLGGGFVPDVAHQRAIQKPFCLYPKILRRSEEHTSELQSRFDLVCRLLLEKKKQQQ